MPELLLAEAVPAEREPPEGGRRQAQWCAARHDGFDARGGSVDAANLDLMTSWLRVQAVGRDTVILSESRAPRYAAAWSRAAGLAGYAATRILGEDGGTTLVEPAPSAPAATAAPAITYRLPDSRPDRIRLWLADRIESAGRRAIRAVER